MTDNKKCEYYPCEEEATCSEVGKAVLGHFCAKHKKIVRLQKKADNNY